MSLERKIERYRNKEREREIDNSRTKKQESEKERANQLSNQHAPNGRVGVPSVLCLQEALHDVLRSRKDQSNRPWLRHEVLDLSLVLWALALHGSKLRAGWKPINKRTHVFARSLDEP